MTKFTAAEANAYMDSEFGVDDSRARVTLIEDRRAVMRLNVDRRHLRPGGYVSGPTQMSMVDSVAYYAIMSVTGLEPMAVTSNLNINFLRPCIGDVVIADGRLMKIGQALAVIEVDIRVEGAEKAASHAIVTYALPRKQDGAA